MVGAENEREVRQVYISLALQSIMHAASVAASKHRSKCYSASVTIEQIKSSTVRSPIIQLNRTAELFDQRIEMVNTSMHACMNWRR